MRVVSALILFMSLTSQAQTDKACLRNDGEVLPDVVSSLSILSTDSFVDNCPQRDPYPDLFPAVSTIKDLRDEIETKFKTIGIEVQWGKSASFLGIQTSGPKLGSGSWEQFTNTPEDMARLKKLANITFASLALYPSEVFDNSKMKTIYLAKNLSVAGQLRKAMPAPEKNSLIFADNNDLVCDPGLELRIHHEYFHYLEGKASGNMRAKDPKWLEQNPEAFSYGKGGHETYNCVGGFRNTGHVKPGFVSRYALSAHEEDRAETFGWMMTKGFDSQLDEWSKTDPVLKKKKEMIIEFMKKFSNKD